MFRGHTLKRLFTNFSKTFLLKHVKIEFKEIVAKHIHMNKITVIFINTSPTTTIWWGTKGYHWMDETLSSYFIEGDGMTIEVHKSQLSKHDMIN